MSIHKLPEDTICKIFSLVIHNKFPPYMLPESDFGSVESHTLQFDNVTPDILAGVCKRWRTIALSDPVLWSTLFLSLRDPTGQILRRAGKVVAHCIERSDGLPLSCFLSIDTDPEFPFEKIMKLDHKLIFRLVLNPWLLNQHRWRCIDIHFPQTYITAYLRTYGGELQDEHEAYSRFILAPSEMRTLEAIRLDTGLHHIRSITPFLFCSVVKLDIYSEGDKMQFLQLIPNVEKLTMSAIGLDGRAWHSAEHRATLFRLRSLTLDAPMSVLRLLSCPALEYLTVNKDKDQYIGDLFGFLRRVPSLHTFHIRNVLRPCVVERATCISIILSAIPVSVTRLALSLDKLRDASAAPFFELLSRKHLGGINANSDVFCDLPALEHVELKGSFHIPWSNLLGFVTARWNAKGRTLASLKLDGCAFESDGNSIFISHEQGMLGAIREKMKTFVDEGLVLEVS